MISALRAFFPFISHLKCLGSLAVSPHSLGRSSPGSTGLDQSSVPACASDRNSCPDPLPSSFTGFGRGGAFSVFWMKARRLRWLDDVSSLFPSLLCFGFSSRHHTIWASHLINKDRLRQRSLHTHLPL